MCVPGAMSSWQVRSLPAEKTSLTVPTVLANCLPKGVPVVANPSLARVGPGSSRLRRDTGTATVSSVVNVDSPWQERDSSQMGTISYVPSVPGTS